MEFMAAVGIAATAVDGIGNFDESLDGCVFAATEGSLF